MFVRFGLFGDAVVSSGGKWTLVGHVNLVWSRKFPTTAPPLGLLLRIEGDHREIGKHVLRLDFVNDLGERLGGPDPVQFAFDRPNVSGFPIEFVIGVTILNLPLPKAGNYDFTVRVDDTYLDSVPLYVRQLGDVQEPAKGS